jgi:hypothetical protein
MTTGLWPVPTLARPAFYAKRMALKSGGCSACGY